MGYRYEPNKFKVAGLTPIASDIVKAPRAKECPVQLEAVVENIRPFGENDLNRPFPAVAVEVRVVRVHVHEGIVDNSKPNRMLDYGWYGQLELPGSLVGGRSEIDEVSESLSHSLC
jgi:flavin reductase (DIM6/NTAB) family NADH-FMN oxidoreductase RutF